MQQQEQALWSRNFITICVCSFFIFMTFYILAVTLPAFVLDDLHGSKQQIGLVTTVFIIAAVIFRPLTGKWLDEVNRKKLILVSLAIFAVCTVLHLFVSSFYLLLVLRFVHGIGFGIAATATSAVVIHIIPNHRKGEGIGYFSLFMSLAMVIGPFLGLMITSHFTFNVLFGVCFILSALALLCALITRIPEKEGGLTAPASSASSWDWRKLIEPKAIPISLAGSVLAFSYGAISTFISVYAKSLGLEQVASYFFMVFAAVILLSRPFTGRLFDRMGEHVLVYPGIVLFVIGMIWLSQAHTAGVFLLTGGIIGLGYGALLPSFQAIAVKSSPSHRSGLATGTYFVFFDSGYGLGSYLLGLIAAKTSYHTMYLIGGIVVAFTVILYYGLHHKKKPRAAEAQSA
ncbi:MFS transporter [Paenibacillus doosanensis]|uniref:MFS transporter n=1 Tax=Paenibacillus doosanensis TaxID=1229154 RepID=UPI00217FBF58|nr:MFS transporter [Paenibacillus doosanensis]MCS7463949.1 MFS transporter [Paenibacillus doosanensis]